MIAPEDIKVVSVTECKACGSCVTEIIERDEGPICTACYEEDHFTIPLGGEIGLYACRDAFGEILHLHETDDALAQCQEPQRASVVLLTVTITDIEPVSGPPRKTSKE